MATDTFYLPYHAKRILNEHQRAAWDHYSAAPYVGCKHACHTCTSCARKYYPFDDPADFGRIVRFKEAMLR